jgi:endoglucanase
VTEVLASLKKRAWHAIYTSITIILVLLPAPLAATELVLKKGVNFEAWQNWTNKADFLASWYDRSNFPDWSKSIRDTELAALRAQGFDFVRLNVDASPFFWNSEPDKLIDSVLASAQRLRAAGLKVIVDLHTMPNMDERPEGVEYILGSDQDPSAAGFERYKSVVRAVARRLAQVPGADIGLELVNEPNKDWSSFSFSEDTWPRQLKELYLAARSEAPELPLILTGARGGGIEGLLRLDPAFSADDPNTIWSFHYYEPFVVTHSGLPWESDARHFLQRAPFPAFRIAPDIGQRLLQEAQVRIEREIPGPDERKKMADEVKQLLNKYVADGWSAESARKEFARVKVWADAHGIAPRRILLGEFGVFQDSADPDARVEWLRAVRTAAEDFGFCWAVYTAGLRDKPTSFGIMDGTGRMTVESRAALALGLSAQTH